METGRHRRRRIDQLQRAGRFDPTILSWTRFNRLQPESRILLFGTDRLDYITTWLAAVSSGIIPIVVSDLYKPPDLLYFLADTSVHALFIDREQLPKLMEIRSELPPSPQTVIVRGEGAAELARHLSKQAIRCASS